MRTLLAALLLACSHLALAQQPAPPEVQKAVREVVQAQLDAFQADDAARAFALATPGIRETFGNAATFMAMVQQAYPAVYRPKTVAFEPAVLVDGEVVQAVRLTDQEGRAWIAIYPMQRQPDGSWKTNGCQLARLSGTQT